VTVICVALVVLSIAVGIYYITDKQGGSRPTAAPEVPSLREVT
jgi:hypothetical protein